MSKPVVFTEKAVRELWKVLQADQEWRELSKRVLSGRCSDEHWQRLLSNADVSEFLRRHSSLPPG